MRNPAPLDFTGLNTYSLHERHSKVTVADFAQPVKQGMTVRELIANLPKQLAGKDAFTVEFRDPTRPRKVTKELIDHILMTPASLNGNGWIRFIAGSAVIGHQVSEKYTDNKGNKPDERPSDHIPVWADFKY